MNSWNEAGRVWEDDHGMLDAEQVAQCERADIAEPLRSPIPTRMISNGEYMPVPQTEQQRRVEARIEELAATASDKLGISRRFSRFASHRRPRRDIEFSTQKADGANLRQDRDPHFRSFTVRLRHDAGQRNADFLNHVQRRDRPGRSPNNRRNSHRNSRFPDRQTIQALKNGGISSDF